MIESLDVSIIIVNYMKYQMTENCISTILSHLENVNYEIIVVDNCSPNESFVELSNKYEAYKHVHVIKTNENKGFGAGNNFAISYVKADYILFLNPDILLLDSSIREMIELLHQNPNIGIIGAQLLNEDYSLQYSCRRFLPLNEFLLSRTPLKNLISKTKFMELNKKYLMKDINHEIAQDVDWLMGSCLLVRKSEFIKLGGFSQEYFMYFEDVDLCYKYKLEKQKVYYYPGTKMIHLHGQESVKKINKLTFRHLESMLKFYKKYKVI